jgi:hypothetical protein
MDPRTAFDTVGKRYRCSSPTQRPPDDRDWLCCDELEPPDEELAEALARADAPAQAPRMAAPPDC